MPTTNQHETYDQEKPKRAAIYLREHGTDEWDIPLSGPSIDQQRLLCRCAATVLHAEVIDEHIEEPTSSTLRPGLRLVLKLAGQNQRLDYLIVSSWDRLADDHDEAFEIAWRLSLEGTVVIPVDADDKFPWTGATPPS
jgi:DNA invertase Pin-like site-specific DNA recombinase